MSKMIFISDNSNDIELVNTFAKENQHEVEHYSCEEWEKKNQPGTKPYLEPIINKNKRNSNNTVIPFSPVRAFNSMEELKEEAIKKALIISNGNASKAACMLKIGRATLYRKIKQLGFDLESLRRMSAEQTNREPAVLKKSA